MMNDNKQATRRRLVRATYTLATLMLLLVCGAAREAQAQWTTSGSNVTTTNNVGIGTTTPATPLEIQAQDAPITLSQAGVAAKATLQAAIGTDLHLSANAKWL